MPEPKTFLIFAPDSMLKAVAAVLKAQDPKRITLLRASEACDMAEATPHDVLLIRNDEFGKGIAHMFRRADLADKLAFFEFDPETRKFTTVEGVLPPVTAANIQRTENVDVTTVARVENEKVIFPSGERMDAGDACRAAAAAMGIGLMKFLELSVDDQMIEITKLDPGAGRMPVYSSRMS